jgi:hypothetical protein
MGFDNNEFALGVSLAGIGAEKGDEAFHQGGDDLRVVVQWNRDNASVVCGRIRDDVGEVAVE